MADFLIERDDPPETNERNMPRRCVTHVMNKFNLSSFFFARCAGPTGSPSRGGMKPCISKILVNYTYNALMDVADCMNINPKSLLPKLSNESGLIINTFGSGMDAGVGQLTGDAIEEVNKYFDGYLREIRAAATAGKVSCQRIVKNPKLITLVAAGSGSRCGLIAPVEKINFNRVVEMVNLVGYNAGPPTAFKMFMDYLNRRVAYNKLPNVKRRLLTEVDFDFHNPKKQKDDIDGVERTVVEIARLNVNAPMIKKEEKPNKTRLDRIRALPEKIRTSHLLTFPEFLIYRQNNFDASILNPTNLGRVNDVKNPEEKEKERGKYPSFKTLAAPGYLNFLAAKDNAIRTTFETAGQSQWLCSDKNFLKIKPVK